MKVFLLFVSILVTASAAPNSRIVGGQQASERQFPQTCSLQWGSTTANQHICGVTIIDANWVLTAAHCWTDYSATTGVFDVVCGITNLVTGAPSEQRRRVAEFVIHEGYIGGVAPHDIAVFRLESPLLLNEYVVALTMPQPGVIPTGDAYTAGWGSTSETTAIVWPDNLKYVEVPIIDMATCAAAFGDWSALYINSNVCTGPMTGGKSSCLGDSGGPLLQGDVQVGIVSWGPFPCGSVNGPGVYAQVSFYYEWIRSHAI